MRWNVREQRTLYQSDWVNVELADVELPDGRHLDHHVLRMHRQSTSAAVIDDQGRVLMLWRHRFITNRWGWELPCGWVNSGEDPAEATRREVWRRPAGSLAHSSCCAPTALTSASAMPASTSTRPMGRPGRDHRPITPRQPGWRGFPSARFATCLIGAKSMMAHRSPPSSTYSRSRQSAPR
jgi:NUDIX domain